jgi:hypothetical protein
MSPRPSLSPISGVLLAHSLSSSPALSVCTGGYLGSPELSSKLSAGVAGQAQLPSGRSERYGGSGGSSAVQTPGGPTPLVTPRNRSAAASRRGTGQLSHHNALSAQLSSSSYQQQAAYGGRATGGLSVAEAAARCLEATARTGSCEPDSPVGVGGGGVESGGRGENHLPCATPPPLQLP